METQASVAKGATSLYIANIIALLANTLYFLVLTNILRSTLGVGIVTSLNIMILLFVTISILAQPVTLQSPVPAPLAVLKFIPELLAKNTRRGAVKVFYASLSFTLILGVAIASILIAAPKLIIPFVGGQAVLPSYIQLAGVDVLAFSLLQVCIGTLIALGDVKSATIYLILWSIVRYTLASLLLIPYAITGVLLGWIVGDAAVLVAALFRSTRDLRDGRGKKSSLSVTDVARYSLYTLFSALIGFAISQADKIFMLTQQGLPELAIYNVAIVAASFAGFAPYALLTVLLPALSALHARNRKGEMRRMIQMYTRYVSIIVLPIALGFASITDVALRIFGPDYVIGFAPSVIVSVATGLTAIGVVYAAVLLAVGRLRWYTAANVLGLGGLILISYLLTPLVGLSGPALGRACLLALAAVVYAIATHRSGFFRLDWKAYLSAAGSSSIMGLIVYFALTFAHSFLAKLAMLPVAVVLGALIYLGSLRAMHLFTARDLTFLRDIVPNRFHGLLEIVARLAGI